MNVRAPFVLTQALVPGMVARRWGRIVNITSIFGIVSRAGRASYSMSKFALQGLTAALAVEVAKDGVLVNSVAPGFLDTDLTRRILGDAGMQRVASEVPVGRLGNTAEVAKLVLWLASRDNSYVVGQNYAIDGGFTAV